MYCIMNELRRVIFRFDNLAHAEEAATAYATQRGGQIAILQYSEECGWEHIATAGIPYTEGIVKHNTSK